MKKWQTYFLMFTLGCSLIPNDRGNCRTLISIILITTVEIIEYVQYATKRQLLLSREVEHSHPFDDLRPRVHHIVLY